MAIPFVVAPYSGSLFGGESIKGGYGVVAPLDILRVGSIHESFVDSFRDVFPER